MERVNIELTSINDSEIRLNILDNEKADLLYSEVIGKNTKGFEDYDFTILSCGTTKEGVYCLALAVYENVDEELPYGKELAYYINKDNSVTKYSENLWSNSVLGAYYEYNENLQDFQLFRPMHY